MQRVIVSVIFLAFFSGCVQFKNKRSVEPSLYCIRKPTNKDLLCSA
jgi:hypothetical protein